MLRRHVENDNPAATRELGFAYERGRAGLVPSHKKAARHFKRAAELGDVTAMNSLGVCYTYGQGVKLDKKKAAKYYRMAAGRGYAAAQIKMGLFFERGIGVAQDLVESFRWYKLAADQGLTIAESKVGSMYAAYGDLGVARDADEAADEAARWFERAAAKGDGLARLRELQRDRTRRS